MAGKGGKARNREPHFEFLLDGGTGLIIAIPLQHTATPHRVGILFPSNSTEYIGM